MDIPAIYQETILKHNRNPNHYGQLTSPTHHASGFSRLCGESLDVYLVVNNQSIEQISFSGDVSAVAMAAASIMTSRMVGKSTKTVQPVAESLFRYLDQKHDNAVPSWISKDNELASFSVLRGYRSRKAAAKLPWQTLCKALDEGAMMSDWTKVAKVGEIDEGSFKLVNIDGAPIAVFYIGREYLAIENFCTHDGGELTGGPVHGCQIECPRHGAIFDIRTGEALTPPAYEPVATFPIKITDGVIYTRDDRWD